MKSTLARSIAFTAPRTAVRPLRSRKAVVVRAAGVDPVSILGILIGCTGFAASVAMALQKINERKTDELESKVEELSAQIVELRTQVRAQGGIIKAPLYVDALNTAVPVENAPVASLAVPLAMRNGKPLPKALTALNGTLDGEALDSSSNDS